MGNAREHHGLIAFGVFDTLHHVVERRRELTQFAWPARLDRRQPACTPERARGLRDTSDWQLKLPRGEQRKHDRRKGHPSEFDHERGSRRQIDRRHDPARTPREPRPKIDRLRLVETYLGARGQACLQRAHEA
ncbi:hypothetical protein LMG28138_06117 [Pararobbsia alpina]|uniref:Uncharacterized protein n=1 Tax=Pararobbsia alpina TaxID=621374 RepID=A0A6S7D7T5_9BURK|nr:hypothetical protein LMG28138_06117 [Pararobbsia alpina]